HGPVQARKAEKLLKRYHPHLLRAKGYVPLAGRTDTHLLQYAAKRTEWEAYPEASEHYLVLIGIDLPVAHIQQEWNDITS
ncbi:GTP-binding protein, partial [Acinetobacter baumannii]|uniref:GTP-binding protein n=1 Tax=Acinetobacter baumannii TaxID=470 RepID=UPI00148A02F0